MLFLFFSNSTRHDISVIQLYRRERQFFCFIYVFFSPRGIIFLLFKHSAARVSFFVVLVLRREGQVNFFLTLFRNKIIPHKNGIFKRFSQSFFDYSGFFYHLQKQIFNYTLIHPRNNVNIPRPNSYANTFFKKF